MSETVASSLSSQRRVKKSAAPPFPPTEGGCHFYIPKKNRYCKMVPGKNQKYCGEHIMNESGQEVPATKIRVPCPIDPTHTCFQNQIQKHLKICNARLVDQPAGIMNLRAVREMVFAIGLISLYDFLPNSSAQDLSEI